MLVGYFTIKKNKKNGVCTYFSLHDKSNGKCNGWVIIVDWFTVNIHCGCSG